MLLFMLLPLLLQAQLPAAQKMGFYVKDHCVDNPELNGTGGDFFFVAGCTVRILCKYTQDQYCRERNTTDMAIIPGENHKWPAISLINSSMVEVEKTQCSITVDIRNITMEHTGPYTCMDRDYEGAIRYRNIEVGEVPMVPQNMTMVYEPGQNITLYLDPVKKGRELGDNHTKWSVTYNWLNDSQTCSKQSDSTCQNPDPEGMCSACIIKVRAQMCGQVLHQGSVFNMIYFNISVHNKFGRVSDKSSIFLPDFIKPAPVRDIKIPRYGIDWIDIRVIAPKDFDQCHLEEIKTDDNKLSYNYTWDLVSLRDQGLEEGEKFFQTYGFVRNLEDDEAALSDTVRSAFPRYSELHLWESNKVSSAKRLEAQPQRIRDLPFAGYMYNISVQTKAHYWGGVLWVKAKTEESAPKEGPQLHENFAYCPLINESCAVCLIYFKEIPRPMRGGIVLNHTLLLTSLNSDAATESKCDIGKEVEERTGSQNNTFRVFSVPVGGVYNVSVWAETGKELSPVTNAILNVHSTPPSFAAQDIVLESTGASYDISWKPGSVADGVTLKYFLHNCSAIPLQLYNVEGNGNESSLPTVPLNCVTNMASLEVAENSTNSHTFDNTHHGRGLTPAFFVSTITSTNLTSGLLPVDCFYAKSMVPDQVTSLEVQKVEGDPGTVDVMVQLPCGQDLNYKFGRPDSYAIVFARDDGSQDCKKTVAGQDWYPPLRIETKLKDKVVYRKKGLEKATSYCTCVHLFARSDTQRDMWTCKRFNTGSEPESAFPGWLIGLLVVASIFVVAVILYGSWKIYRCYEEDREKFGTDDEKEGMVPSPPVKNKLLNEGHINPKMPMRLDSGVGSTPASPVVIDMPADTFSSYPGDENDESQSEEDENEDTESFRDHQCVRNESQSSNPGSAEDNGPNIWVAGATSRYAAGGSSATPQHTGLEDEEEEENEEDEDEVEEEEYESDSCTASERNLEGVEELEESGEEEEDEEEDELEEEEEELDPDVDKDGVEPDQLVSRDIEVSMPMFPLSTQNPDPAKHTADSKSAAGKAGLPPVLRAIKFLQGVPSLHQASSARDVPEQADLQKPSVEEIVQAFQNSQMASAVPPTINLTGAGLPAETGDRMPLRDVSKTHTVSSDNSTLHCPESEVDSLGDVLTNEIHETQAATDRSVESGLGVYEGERDQQCGVEDSSAEADGSHRPRGTKDGHPAAGVEGMGAESTSHRDTEVHESETDLDSEEKLADSLRDPEAAAACPPLSQLSQLSEQGSVDDIMKAAEGCAWMSPDLAPVAGHPDSADQDSPDLNEDPSGSESNRNSICGPESGFESESSKETDSETDKTSTENLVPKRKREQPTDAASQADKASPSAALSQDTTVLSNLRLSDISVKASSVPGDPNETSPEQTGVEHNTSHHLSGPTVSIKAPPRSKHSANHATKHESSDHMPLLDKKNRAESSDSESTEFVSENKAFAMEENGENKAEQRRKDGSKKYWKVTREADSKV